MLRNQRGITLGSLIVYIIITIIATTILATIIASFSSNVSGLVGENVDIIEIDKFNTYFLKEVKKTNNDVESISEDKKTITFSSGNRYNFSGDAIYLNVNIKISKGIEDCTFEESEQNGKKIITTNITLKGTKYTREFVLSNTANTTEIVNEIDYTYYHDGESEIE